MPWARAWVRAASDSTGPCLRRERRKSMAALMGSEAWVGGGATRSSAVRGEALGGWGGVGGVGGGGGDEVIGGEGGGAEEVQAQRLAAGAECEAERVRFGAEVVFDGGQDAVVVGEIGVGGEEEGRAGGGRKRDGATTTVEGFRAGLFGQVADDEDGGVGGFGDGGEGAQHEADGLVLVGVDGGGEDGHQGVDDDERRGMQRDGMLEGGDVIGEDGDLVQGEGAAATEIGLGGLQAGTQGIAEAVFGVDEEHVGGVPGGVRVVGEGKAAGDAGGQV